MKSFGYSVGMFLATLILSTLIVAQQSPIQPPPAVPRLVNFAGKAIDPQGKAINGIVGVTFAIYKDQSEGAPLWRETQNVAVDVRGNYTAQMGASKSSGLPLELFSSGEARWLGVRVNGGSEQARVLLLSVPYALKAEDAATLGGLPPSAFVLAAPVSVAAPAADDTASATASPSVPPPGAITGSGTAHYVPLFTGTAALGNSILFQSGTGTSAKIGINTKTPVAALDVKGGATVRGLFSLPTTGNAIATAGKNSQAINFSAAAFNSASSTSVLQNFRWQAEPASNNTAGATATLNLLFGQGSTLPAETGLKLSHTGQITFAAGQKFPRTVTSVAISAPASDFTVTGSPVTGAGTLGLNWVVAPTSYNTANAIVKRDSNGGFSAGAVFADSIYGDAGGTPHPGVTGVGNVYGVVGFADTDGGTGIAGQITNTGIGVHGMAGSAGKGGQGVLGESYATLPYGNYGNDGVDGVAHQDIGSGVGAVALGNGDGLYAYSATGYAGVFIGDVYADGNLSKGAGSFKIDHPLDPANKYLYHSFVESSDMKNIYDGNVTTDAEGNAVVTLPDWFEALNRDFRYQLTVIGQFAQAIVASRSPTAALPSRPTNPMWKFPGRSPAFVRMHGPTPTEFRWNS